jgi:fatty acid desaturase
MELAIDASLEKPGPGAVSDESTQFVRQVHDILRDLLQPRPAIFWIDFLVTASVCYAALAVYLLAADFSAVQVVAFVLCALANYRAVVFTHELSHRSPGTFTMFRWFWNEVCGIPVLMPSFLYGDHRSHHANRSYGTRGDPEYVFLARSRWNALAFLLAVFVYPLLGPLRFLFLTPLALVSRVVDRLVWCYASSLYMMNPEYRREYDASAHDPARWAQEIACCLWAWCLVSWAWTGALPVHILVKTYGVLLFWMAINQLRTLTAHRYSNHGMPQSYIEQLLDTNTFPAGTLLAEVWAPLGLRYHALHHVMPSLPYHAAKEAHVRLMQRLPPEAPYRKTLQPGLWAALKDVVTNRA